MNGRIFLFILTLKCKLKMHAERMLLLTLNKFSKWLMTQRFQSFRVFSTLHFSEALLIFHVRFTIKLHTVISNQFPEFSSVLFSILVCSFATCALAEVINDFSGYVINLGSGVFKKPFKFINSWIGSIG